MQPITYYSTNNKDHKKSFEDALLCGLAPDYGLYMLGKASLPRFSVDDLEEMRSMSYAQIAFKVLSPFLSSEIPEKDLLSLLEDAYRVDKIPTEVKNVTGRTYIMWLTQGPTYSFKDYAARFFARTLNYFLGLRSLRRTVVVATSGDTGGAVADALFGLDNVDCVVFYPKGSISEGQRRQMTTLKGNVFAFEVNGDFDVCQALAKNLLGDKEFAEQVFSDKDRLTSANSISVGRLLPQAVYPFFAYSRISHSFNESFIASIPSGNFGDMMGTMLAKNMGLPVSKIVCGVNENTEFPDFLLSGEYVVSASKKSPSSAMIVSHPSNLARLIDLYDGHMFDERDSVTKKVIKEGVIDKMPDLEEMRRDIFSVSVTNPEHFSTIKRVFDLYGVVLDPHGAVGWCALEKFSSDLSNLSVIYETADPGKFPDDIVKAIGVRPPLPQGMQKQLSLSERTFSINESSISSSNGLKLSDSQIKEAKQKLSDIFSKK